MKHFDLVILSLSAFIVALSLAIFKYGVYLPSAYIFIVTCLFLLIYLALKYNCKTIYLPLLLFYAIFIISPFAIRFGLFHGDSQIDLASVLYIVDFGHIEQADYYTHSLYPIIHILTVMIGAVVGIDDISNVHEVAIWIPSIVTLLSIVFIYLTTKNVLDSPKIGFYASIVWISLPFVSRWMMQYTRTTVAIPFLIMLGFLFTRLTLSKRRFSNFALILIVFVGINLAHPVVALFLMLSLVFLLICTRLNIITTRVIWLSSIKRKFTCFIRNSLTIGNEMVGKSSKEVDNSFNCRDYNISVTILALFIIFAFFWVYTGHLIPTLVSVYEQFAHSFEIFFQKSIVSDLVSNKAAVSYAVATPELKVFGLSRVGIYILLSSFGLLFLLFSNLKRKIYLLSLGLFGLLFMVINFTMGISSTTSYRTAVYSSIWMILTFAFCIQYLHIHTSKVKIFKGFMILISVILILPAPFFCGEVVLPSDWMYSSDPSISIDYSHGEVQRFLNHYHFDLPQWIGANCPEDVLIWADGTHGYSAVLGYARRPTMYSSFPLDPDGINVNSLQQIGINYVFVTDLMRKVLLVPYGIPPYYPNYSFDALDSDINSSKVCSSGDADLYLIAHSQKLNNLSDYGRFKE